jgi:plastocyanin
MGKASATPARIAAVTICAVLACQLHAAIIAGTVVVKRSLTKRKVTIAAGVYDRGASVALESAPPDALAFERTHVAVYLEGPLPAWRPGVADLPAMAQRNRAFLPDMLVVPVGSEVSFPNLDPVFHNVFSLSGSKTFDLGNYPEHRTRTVVMSKSGIVLVNCHLHPNMTGIVVVTPNAWATRPNEGGDFTLPDAPPGKYTVVAWHKSAGFFRKTVEVDATHGAKVEFLVPLEAVPEPVHAARAISEHR